MGAGPSFGEIRSVGIRPQGQTSAPVHAPVSVAGALSSDKSLIIFTVRYFPLVWLKIHIHVQALTRGEMPRPPAPQAHHAAQCALALSPRTGRRIGRDARLGQRACSKRCGAHWPLPTLMPCLPMSKTSRCEPFCAETERGPFPTPPSEWKAKRLNPTTTPHRELSAGPGCGAKIGSWS